MKNTLPALHVQKGQGSHFLRFHCVPHPLLGTLHGVTSHPHNILGRGFYWTITVHFEDEAIEVN